MFQTNLIFYCKIGPVCKLIVFFNYLSISENKYCSQFCELKINFKLISSLLEHFEEQCRVVLLVAQFKIKDHNDWMLVIILLTCGRYADRSVSALTY
jgi:hypothetical protein